MSNQIKAEGGRMKDEVPQAAPSSSFILHPSSFQTTPRKTATSLVEYLQCAMRPDAVSLSLTIERSYRDGERKIVMVGHPAVARRLPANEAQLITYEELRDALALLGWSLVARPHRTGGSMGMDYLWRLQPNAGGLALTPDVWESRQAESKGYSNGGSEQYKRDIAQFLARRSALESAGGVDHGDNR